MTSDGKAPAGTTQVAPPIWSDKRSLEQIPKLMGAPGRP
jgi:hypothetical protein